jgi:hypothetical protein
MFGFLKKLFGTQPTEVAAPAPYKVEAAPAFPAPAVVETPAKAEVKAKPAAPKKKPAGQKPAGQKPATKQGGSRRGGRKPKAKPAV